MDNRILYLIVCAAPPARQITELIGLLHADGWDVYVITTPTALTWIPAADVEKLTGHPVSHRTRQPDEPRSLPQAHTILVVPATFNTINQWATGVNNTLALGILNEAIGNRLPVVSSVYAKPALTEHPSFAPHLALLTRAGVRFTETEALKPLEPHEPFRWRAVIELLSSTS